MAQSARTQSLLEQRKSLSGLSQFSGKIRLLSPTNTTISSIARKTITSELEAMTSKYNDGLVSNDEMKAFLIKVGENSTLTSSEKADVETQIRDFDQRIMKDKLETNFKSAPENSLSQVQTAQALADYYKSRASSMNAGTPAYSQALQDAATWDQKVVQINNSVQKLARQNQRSIQEQRIATLPNNSSDRSMARADMWKGLYDQAVADGDATDANKFMTYYNQELTNASEQSTRETTKATNDEEQGKIQLIRDALGQLANDYHDGKIGEQEYLSTLAEISPYVDATNNYGLINTLNRTTDIIQKNLDKGGLRRGTTEGGLPVVLGKGSGSGSGSQTSWDKQDFDYSDDLRLAKAMFDSGKWDGNTYMEAIGTTVEKRAADLEGRIATVYATAQANPNTKILYNGTKQRAEVVLQGLYKEQESIGEQVQAVQGGTFGLVEIPPKEFSASGDVTAKGKSTATYELVDTKNMPQDQYVRDEKGVYHQLLREAIQITDPNIIREAMAAGGYYVDGNGVSYKLNFDKSGNASYYGGGQYADIYEPGTANKKTVSGIQPGQEIGSYDKIMQGESLAQEEASKAAAQTPTMENKKKGVESDLNINSILPGGNPTPTFGETIVNRGKDILKEQYRPVVDAATAVAEKVAPIVSKVVSPVTRVMDKVVDAGLPEGARVNPNTELKLNEPINIPSGSVNMPQVVTSANQTFKPVAMPALKLAAPQPNNLQQLAQQPNFKPITIPNGGPQDLIQKANQPKPGILDQIKNFATKLWPFK